MKSGVPWTIRGIDAEARQAALEAARNAGMPLNQWLNEAIATRASEEGVDPEAYAAEIDLPPDPPRNLAGSIAELTRRIRAMDATSRAAISGMKDRLAEIEGRLVHPPRARPDDRAAPSPQGVSALIDRLSRELDNADESARSTIEGLPPPGKAAPADAADQIAEALRALERRVADLAAPRPPPVTPAAPLDDLKARLEALLARAEPAPPPSSRSAEIDATLLRALEERLDETRPRPAGQPAAKPAADAAPEEEERVRRIEAQLADITGRLGGSEPGARPATPRRLDDLAGAIAEITAHQRELDRERDAPRQSPEAQVEDGITAIRAELAALADRVVAKGRGDAGDRDPAAGASEGRDGLADRTLERGVIGDIRREIDGLRAIAGSAAREATVLDRFEDLGRKVPDRGRLDALVDEVAGLRRALEASDSPRAVARIEMRVNEIARSVESALSSRQATIDASAAALAGGLADIHRAIAARADEARQADETGRRRLEGRLDNIAAGIDGLAEHVAAASVRPAVIEELRAELAAIRSAVAARDAAGSEPLERQIRDLAQRVDAIARPDANAAQLAELEAQMGRIADELRRREPRSDALATVEADLARLQAHLDESRHESIEAARQAARDAVGELAGSAAGSDLMHALKEDLDRIRVAAGESDHRARETLEALHGTLAAVVDRLERLEQEARSAAAADAEADATGTAGPGVPVHPEPAAARVAPLPDQPLEPGSGRPPTAPAPDAGAPDAAVPERSPGERRADFIAAARRAAQAAMAETGARARPPDDKSPSPRGGALARIGQAIRNRRKLLLLAAAAAVLALGALAVLGRGPHAAAGLAEARVKPPAGRTRDFLAAPPLPAPALAGANPAGPALVAPTADASAAAAMAAPDILATRFADRAVAPAAGGFAGEAAAGPAGGAASHGGAGEAAAAQVDLPLAAAIGSEKLRGAAAGGDPGAAFEVAVRYAEGRGVPQDLVAAAAWYRRAAESGVAVAAYRLGSLFERGQGVSKDLAGAAAWYGRAAAEGNVGAMHNLAVLLSEGIDGVPDHARALQWFREAAAYGVKDSEYNLGVIYARGAGVSRDLGESYKWFAIAAGQGDSDAAARRDEVAAALSPEELAKARAAVAGWQPKEPVASANGITAPPGGWDGTDTDAGLNDSDRKALVKKIQSLLSEHGYDPGPADGVEGPKTEEAVRAFQHSIGVADTGTIDQGLVAALSGPTG